MSKRNRPTTAAEATHRLRRHLRRSERNSPEGKAARAAGGQAPTPKETAKKAAAKAPPPTLKSPAPAAAPKPPAKG
jgi:hypothetical protein